MKKTLAALCSVLLVLASCSSNDKETKAPASVLSASQAAPSAGLNIRFIDLDSISAHYILAQEFQKQALASVSKIESVGASKQSEIQRLAQQIEQKGRNNGYLSQESYEGDMQRLNKMQQDAAAYMDNLQRQASTEMAAHQQEMNDSLDNFIRAYNATKGYDAILYRAAGAYFNPALDITNEVIEGLNARYQAGHGKK